MKVLLIGNGFEANYNQIMSNFNNNFINWIRKIKYEDIDRTIESVFSWIYNSKKVNINELVDPDIILFTSEIIKLMKLEISEENFHFNSIEDYFLELGKSIEIGNFGEENYSKDIKIFLAIKNLFGYFIDINTYLYNNALETSNFEPALKGRYNMVLTTNYTNSAEILSEQLNGNKILFSWKVKVYHLHGKFQKGIERYADIEINLNEKKLNGEFEKFKNDTLNYYSSKSKLTMEKSFILDIFGSALYKDRHIIKEILNLLSIIWASSNEINYYFHEEDEKNKILEVIPQIISELNEIFNEDYDYEDFGGIKAEFDIEKTAIKMVNEVDNYDSISIIFNFIDKNEYFLYKDLQKINLDVKN